MNTDMPGERPIRVAILDDHQVFVEALKLVMKGEPGLQVVGEAGTCAGCLEMLKQTTVDVLLLDVSLPDGDGLSLVPHINQLYPLTNILVLTSLSDDATLLRAIDLGVNGFLGKNRHLSEVMGAVRQAAAGEIAIPTSLLLGLLGRKPRPSPVQTEKAGTATGDELTPREHEILVFLAQGCSGAEIAVKMKISPLTVRTHIRNLIDKLGVHSRLEAVTSALRQGLIDPPL